MSAKATAYDENPNQTSTKYKYLGNVLTENVTKGVFQKLSKILNKNKTKQVSFIGNKVKSTGLK